MRFARLTVLTAMALAFVTAPPIVGAQPLGKVYRIGVLHVGVDHVPPHLDGLRAGLKELGYDVDTSPAPRQSTVFEGRNLRLDWRNLTDEVAARVAARELVHDRVDLIVAVEDSRLAGRKARSSAFSSLSQAAPPHGGDSGPASPVLGGADRGSDGGRAGVGVGEAPR